MDKEGKVFVVISAGGVGSRMKGAKLPKQFLKLGGKPIIIHTIDHFEHHPMVDGIVVVCVSGWIDTFKQLARENHYTKILAVVPGGSTGQESIFNGVSVLHNRQDVDDDHSVVLVHDGVRPLIDETTITDCIQSVWSCGCTATTAPSVETVINEEDGYVREVLNREHCKLARAPQGFRLGDFYRKHLQAKEDGINDFVDSISLMSHYGYRIHTVDGPIENIKITTPRDFFTFKAYVDMQEVAQIWEA
ncbi:IspD/TarI family cytidylyltransferase [Bifidobacterium sp. ESL0704]|uniref:IspD/TarI family cytidylyltransferase n=1 Tax=Bifidobacterium sp. ESL0704 TaxID=2983219 RepID=UPI0023F7D798|nr:IspD/TarI family cytidylyltransferase [Bifidobacterium sp. ESL0704]WEV52730.1 IspD/TarI family cytidylyltransferase [Bifidobacterium sp. ESL0704]